MNTHFALRTRNFFVLLGECRGLAARAAFVRFALGSAARKLLGAALPARPPRVTPEPELFLRLRGADLWIGTRSGELGRYMEVFSGPDCDLHTQGPEPGEAILDIGANIGMFSIRYARQFPASRVFALEPNPAPYARLVRNLAANAVPKAEPINLAAAGEFGRRAFYVDGQSILGSLIPDRSPGAVAAFDSDVIAIDAFCRERAIGAVGLIKINVEGAELEVLRGARETLATTRSIMIECHSEELEKSVAALLGEHGFEEIFKRVLRKGLSVVHFARAQRAASAGDLSAVNRTNLPCPTL